MTPADHPRVTIPRLHAMKRAGQKIVAVVAWDVHMARLADRAGAEIVSVGDSVGVNLWGQAHPLEVTLEEMLVAARAARRGTARALLSVDLPFGPLQSGEGLRAAIRLVKEAGADAIKLDGAADFPEAVEALTRAGIPVWAQMGLTPQTALAAGIDYAAMLEPGFEPRDALTERLVAQARRLESAGAALIDFQGSGPVAGPAVVAAVTIPVIGGLGGGPWLDGRVRMAHAALGYAADTADDDANRYADLAGASLAGLRDLVQDVRDARHLRGQGDRTRRGT